MYIMIIKCLSHAPSTRYIPAQVGTADRDGQYYTVSQYVYLKQLYI